MDMANENPASDAPETAYTLIGFIQKPFGLVGELKVKPETFDFDRHEQLKEVVVRLRDTGELRKVSVSASRADARFWYLKFKGFRTPEAAALFSGSELLLATENRLDLPDGMVYFADLPGCILYDENGEKVGKVSDVIDQGMQQLLKIQRPEGDAFIPWNDHFIKKIDVAQKRIDGELGSLRGVTL
jgi:16S rRNA processing protein RimM